MKIHKKVHHHLKKHHKKYLTRVSLGGIGFLAIKIFVLGTGIFGFFSMKEGVFADVAKPPETLPYVELNSTNISQAPFSCTTDMPHCNLDNMNIIGIASGTFANYTNLTTLTLSNNKITSIEVGDFNGAINLETLDLSNNPISFIMTGSFDNFPNLNNISLTNSCNNNQTSIEAIYYECSNTSYTDEESCISAGSCSDPTYTDQTSCENVGSCSDPTYTDQTSCENVGSCSDSIYTDQTSCENAGVCSDYNGNKINEYTDEESCQNYSACYNSYNGNKINEYNDKTSCMNNYQCSDSMYTDETSCLNNFACYDDWGNKINEYTDQTSCENSLSCYDGYRGTVLNEYTDQTSCENSLSCYDDWGDLLNQYTDQTSCENNGYNWNQNYWSNLNWQINSWDQNYWYQSDWSINTRNKVGNKWIGNKWTSESNTWNNYIVEQSNTDHNLCSIIDSTTEEGFITNLTSNGYLLSGDYYYGKRYLNFTNGTTNTILANTIMNDVNDKIEVIYDSGTNITVSGSAYTGILFSPIEFNPTIVEGLNSVSSIIKLGDIYNNIDFSKPITVRIPTPDKNIGDPIKIFYNHNLDKSWIYHGTSTVINISGDPYVEFTTDHATYFAIGEEIGSFVINNDDPSTTTQEVNLTIDASGAINMRFSNDGSNRSTWESYTTSKSWTLSSGAGSKTVYAEFDTDGDYIADASTTDIINFIILSINGQLTLEILTGESECVYGTSLNLSGQDVKLNEGYTFTGAFSGQWYCADYVGISDGWVLDISVSDLTNEGGNIISGSLITIGHDGATTQGDSSCTGYDGTRSTFNTEPYELIEKSSGSDKICKVTLNNVNIEVAVPAFQAPGNYNGTLTLTVPNF